jgi:transposase
VSNLVPLEAAHRHELAEGKQPLVDQLTLLRAIGPKGASILVKEVFCWRQFANRRELASSLGLTPTPHASGSIDREQGISKAGKRTSTEVGATSSMRPTWRPGRGSHRLAGSVRCTQLDCSSNSTAR